jgi:hypothetical protein
MKFEPVVTRAQLDALDTDLIVKGYYAGFRNAPDYTQRDQAYWHGYMNGQVDGGFMPISREQQMLAHEIYEEAVHQIFGSGAH